MQQLSNLVTIYYLKKLKNEIKRSSFLWVFMWFWKIANAQALMQMLLIAVYVNKLWVRLFNIKKS